MPNNSNPQSDNPMARRTADIIKNSEHILELRNVEYFRTVEELTAGADANFTTVPAAEAEFGIITFVKRAEG